MNTLDITIDVTEAAGLGEPAHIALTVTLPDQAKSVFSSLGNGQGQ